MCYNAVTRVIHDPPWDIRVALGLDNVGIGGCYELGLYDMILID